MTLVKMTLEFTKKESKNKPVIRTIIIFQRMSTFSYNCQCYIFIISKT